LFYFVCLLYFFLYFIHLIRVPVFDIPTAVDVLTTGSYPRLPKLLEEPIPPKTLTLPERESVSKRLGYLIQLKLFESVVPEGLKLQKLGVLCVFVDVFVYDCLFVCYVLFLFIFL
jgi:hypothetical protein